MNRKMTKAVIVRGRAQPTAETKKRTAETSISRRRPDPVADRPGQSGPEHAPDEDDAHAQPLPGGRLSENCSFM